MKSLLVLRHAKAERPLAMSSDHDRALVERGVQDAELAGRFLTLARILPDTVLSSTAERARATFLAAAHAGKWKCPVRYEAGIYDGGLTETIAEIGRTEDEAEVLLLVGHEPTLSQLVRTLVGEFTLHYPTCGLVRIDLHVDSWNELRPRCGQLEWFVPAKLLRGGDFDFHV